MNFGFYCCYYCWISWLLPEALPPSYSPKFWPDSKATISSAELSWEIYKRIIRLCFKFRKLQSKCYELNCAPESSPPHPNKKVCWSPNPQYFRIYDICPYLEIISYGGNQTKMKSLGWTLTCKDWCPCKKGTLWTQRQACTRGRWCEETQRESRRWYWSYSDTSQVMSGLPEAERDQDGSFPFRSQSWI